MKKLLFPLLLIIASCNQKKNNTTENRIKKVEPVNLSGCYEMIISRDTALMNINFNGKTVSGQLEYKRFEKDSNKGIFTGTFEDGTIDAWYNFQSEGILSVRQLIFKLEGGKILEGYGDMEQRGDSAVFKYPQTLKYEFKHPYIKSTCK